MKAFEGAIEDEDIEMFPNVEYGLSSSVGNPHAESAFHKFCGWKIVKFAPEGDFSSSWMFIKLHRLRKKTRWHWAIAW